MKQSVFGAATAALLLSATLVAGCDRQADKPARSESATSAATAASDASATVTDETRPGREGRRAGRANRDGALHESGSPTWAGNRNRPAEENAKRMFERNGRDFGAANVDAYVDKVHDFVSEPPSGVLTATRANGDKLLYDPASNTFAVVNRRGAPRIMMKPRNGRAYWDEQLASLNERKGGRRNREGRQGRDGGGDQAAAEDAG